MNFSINVEKIKISSVEHPCYVSTFQ